MSGYEILQNTQKLAHIDIVENYKRACDSRKRVKALVRQTVSIMDFQLIFVSYEYGRFGYDTCVPDRTTSHRKSASKSNQAQQDDALFPIVHRQSLHIHLVSKGWRDGFVERYV